MKTGYAEERPTDSVLKPFCPVSWFHPKGRFRVLQRLLPRLPSVEGSLFMTFSIDQAPFGFDHHLAHEAARKKLRKVFYRLRKGVNWQGQFYQIDASYCVKVEFHASGGAHYHVIFLTKRYVPNELIEHLWGMGYTDVKRISNADFHYLLKYITKDGGPLPEWVLALKTLRIFQSSRGFLLPPESTPEEVELRDDAPEERPNLTTIGERIEKWECTAVFREGVQFSQITFTRPYRDILAEIILPIALEGRYIGEHKIKITKTQQLEIWIQNSVLTAKS